jgi:hypothetical protein
MRENHDGEGVMRVSSGESTCNFAGGIHISRSVCVRTGICGSPERRWQKVRDWERGREHERVGGEREEGGRER